AGEDELRLWNMQTGKMIGELKIVGGLPRTSRNKFRSLAFSPDGKLLAAGDEEGTIELWDVAARKPRPQLGERKSKTHTSVHALAFSPTGKTLAAGHGDYTLHFWDLATGKQVRELPGTGSQTYTAWHDGGIQGLVFTADGRRLISAQDNRLVLLDAQSGEEV